MWPARVNLPDGAVKEFRNDESGEFTYDVTFSVDVDSETEEYDLFFRLPNDVAKCKVYVGNNCCSVKLLKLASDTLCFFSGIIKVTYDIDRHRQYQYGHPWQPRISREDIENNLRKVSPRVFKAGRVFFPYPIVLPAKLDICFTMHMNKQPISKQCPPSFGQLTPLFQEFFESGKDSDFTIICGDRVLKVHKVFLRMQSDFFATTFDTEIEGAAKNSVDLSHCDYRILHEAMRFCYSNKMPPKTMAVDLLQLANELFMPKLKAWAIEVIKKKMTDENVCDILVLADKLHEIGLKFHARCFFLEHCRTVIRTESYRNLPLNLIRELMEAMVEVHDDSISALTFPAC